jgi:trehalose synthase-fused probable maltokinase
MSRIDPRLESVDAGLAAYVAARRWFRGKARTIAGCALVEAIPLPVEGKAEGERVWIGIARVSYAGGGNEDYVLPLTILDAGRAAASRAASPHLVVAERPGGEAVVDALGDERSLASLLPLFAHGALAREAESEIRFRAIGTSAVDALGGDVVPRPVLAEQSNTSIAYGQKYMLKVVRKLDEGVSADLEMGEFLTRVGYLHSPAVAGAVELVRGPGTAKGATVAILHRFVPNRGDAWSFFLERLARRRPAIGAADAKSADVLGEDRALLRLLATRIAELHGALGFRPDLAAFAPERITKDERASLAGSARASLGEAFASLASKRGSLAPELGARVATLLAAAPRLEARLADFAASDVVAWKTRVHGDLHLGQVLVAGDDFVLIDFEGEPARPLAERTAKRSPLADVAGMLRSLHYAAMSAARARRGDGGAEREMAHWYREAAAAFLDAYFEGARGTSLFEAGHSQTRALLDFYLLEKCVYEIHYEMNNRPDWIGIPLAGLAQLIEGADAS